MKAPALERIGKAALLTALFTAAAAAAAQAGSAPTEQPDGMDAETVLHGNPRGEPAARDNVGTPPDLTIVRYNEDYSYLRDPSHRTGAWWEPFKYIPLNATGNAYLTLGGELRFRPESTWNPNWGEAAIDRYQWYRVVPYGDLHLGSNVRLFGQLIGSWAPGKTEPGGIDATGVDILQAFADARFTLNRNAELTLRGGRQVVSIGSERLIGSRYGPNVPLSFNLGRALLEWGGAWRVDAFYGRPVASRPGNFNDKSDDGEELWTAYASHKLKQISPTAGLDVYYIGYRNASATFNRGTGRELRHTIGSRFFGKKNRWDWNSEAMFQFGTFANDNIRAWSVQTDTGYTLSNWRFKPRFGLKANIISGDRNPARSTLQTFNSMFPKGQYLGQLVLIGPTNLINAHPNVTFRLDDHWTLSAAAVWFWRESLGDGIYDPGGNLVRKAGTGQHRYIGNETDIALGWQPVRWLSADMAFGVFRPGAFVRDTGPSKTARYVRFQASVKF